MADYRLIYTTLKTGAVIGEVPVIATSFSQGMNTAGSLNASLLLEDTATMEAPDGVGGMVEITTPQLVSATSLAPGGTGVYLVRDGVILWGGVIWTLRMDVGSSEATIAAEGFMSYLRRVNIHSDLAYSGIDQGAIAKDLLERAMARGGADIGLTAPVPTPSTSRDRVYPAIERKSYGSAIEQLAAVRDGFTWRFEHSWDETLGGVDTTLQLDVSPLGRLTSIVFDLGTNMALLDLSLDGKAMTNYAEAWGAADVSERGFFRAAFDASAITNFPLLEMKTSFSDVKSADTLQEKADEMIARGASPLRRLKIEVFAGAVPVLGSYEVGDRVECRGSYGGLSISGIWRIVDFGLSVDTDGLESISLGLVPQEVF